MIYSYAIEYRFSISMECLSDLIRNAQVDNVTLYLPFQPSISKACLKINGHHIAISREDHADVKVIGNWLLQAYIKL